MEWWLPGATGREKWGIIARWAKRFSFARWKASWQCELSHHHWTVHFKMVNFMLCAFTIKKKLQTENLTNLKKTSQNVIYYFKEIMEEEGCDSCYFLIKIIRKNSLTVWKCCPTGGPSRPLWFPQPSCRVFHFLNRIWIYVRKCRTSKHISIKQY